MRRIVFPLAVAAAALPGTALAHAALVSANPAAGATVSKPERIALNFSEDVVGPLSGIDLVMTGMPGMANHQPMPIRGFTAQAKGKALTAALPRALPTGTYRLAWHAAGADQHRVEGSYAFTVK
ncbi:copper homeostasis periplasmic binding protein CopC [Novosphingobium gossypii]|uniref:copper homeostasis periplasmic binding protein CopC n=1 Tax=Novosphingobium gossypii TaxID=1604774 RepID=UPI003D1AC0D1